MAMMTADEARDYLLGFDHCYYQQVIDYLNVALHRLLVTLSLMPAKDEGARVLELGSAPYFMTSLLLHHFPCQLELANEPYHLEVDGGQVTLINSRRGLHYRFEYRAFNVETDQFPYEDGRFDTVLYCEMIEHLMHDPSHSLYEIHRVLKPGGHLVLSTPNPFRYTNYLKFLTGRSIYPPFSGWGPYARHNREFSCEELRLLLRQCNFEIETLITAHDPAYYHPRWLDRLARGLHRYGLLQEKMDVIHLRARSVGRAVYRYPPGLYLDISRYQHIVSDSIEIGVNDEAQLGDGYYEIEHWPGWKPIRWTFKKAVAKLLSDNRSGFGIRFYSGPPQLSGRVTGAIVLNGAAHHFDLQPDTWAELRFPLPAVHNGHILVELQLDNTWIPREIGISRDTRQLGVALQSMWLE